MTGCCCWYVCLVVIVGLLLAARRASLVRIVWTRRCRLIQLCSFFIHCLCHAVQIALIVWFFLTFNNSKWKQCVDFSSCSDSTRTHHCTFVTLSENPVQISIALFFFGRQGHQTWHSGASRQDVQWCVPSRYRLIFEFCFFYAAWGSMFVRCTRLINVVRLLCVTCCESHVCCIYAVDCWVASWASAETAVPTRSVPIKFYLSATVKPGGIVC